MLETAFLEKARAIREGLVETDPETLKNYGIDWTRKYDPDAGAVAFPESTDEVSRLLKLCNECGIQVVPSGGRTGLAGGAVATNGELILNLEKMSRIDTPDPLSMTLRVEAGAITAKVHQTCQAKGLDWPVHFASEGSSQIGGNLATNAGGINVIRYGTARNWVLGLTIVTIQGDIVELNGALEKNNTGYHLRDLLIGSEGTLAVITEATLKLTKHVKETSLFMLGVDGMKEALELLLFSRMNLSAEILAFEYFTRECLEVVLENSDLVCPLEAPASAYVLLEVEGNSREEKIESFVQKLFQEGRVVDGTLAPSAEAHRRFWALRENITECLSQRGYVHKNDLSVAISELNSFFVGIESEYRKAYEARSPGYGLYVFGHLGDGNLHLNVLKPKDQSKEDFISVCEEADQSLFALVQKHNGSISAEHGIGLLKKDFLSYSRSDLEVTLFRRIKRAFDPRGLLNPGKIFDIDAY